MARPSRHRNPSAGSIISPTSFKAKREHIRTLHENGARGFTTCLRLSGLADRLLQDAFALHAPGAPFAVIALGGYGRRELCFWSDVDTMVLTRPGAGVAEMKAFYHSILGYGLDIGHSYRTVDDCLSLRHTDIDAWISLLDARFVCGDRTVFRELLTRLAHDLKSIDLAPLLERIHSISDERHAKYGRSTKLLEPNIKNSSGGFRDAQTVLWLYRLTRSVPVGQAWEDAALHHMLRGRKAASMFPTSFLKEARNGLDTLFRIRHQMHLHAGTLHDILEFSSQEPIARTLGYRSAGAASSVERFMQDYYDAANSVAELYLRVADWTRDRWLRTRERPRISRVSADLRVRGGRISLAPRKRLTSEVLLQAYVLRLTDGLEFSFTLEDSIHRKVSSLTALRSRKPITLFCSLFSHDTGVSEALRHMNRFGLLARWLPEWRPLVRFFQHNQYHYFTADEHTLTVIQKAEDLRSDPSSFGDAFRALRRKDVLYFACLFHDITKPRRLDDHEVTGAELASSVLKRFGMDDIAEDVAFLVRHHLTMEQVAFRRNLADPITLRDFADRFPRAELLPYLFVLTYADLSAVNRNVLTEWKKTLLTELYMKTLPLLSAGIKGALHMTEPGVDELLRSLPQDDADRHGSLLRDDAYRRTFSRSEIAEHIGALRDLDVSASIFHHWSDVSDMTLLTKDAPFVLARVCGVIYANDLSIIDARIFTREDGIVIDSFRVVDSQSHRPLTEERCRSVDAEVHDVLVGACSVEDLLERHRKRWKRRAAHVNPNVRVDVDFEDHPHFTIIDVFGADTPGLLYALSDTISRQGCSIHFAKISTRGDGIVDTFYVRDANGRPITSVSRRSEIRQALLERMRSMYDPQPTSPAEAR